MGKGNETQEDNTTQAEGGKWVELEPSTLVLRAPKGYKSRIEHWGSSRSPVPPRLSRPEAAQTGMSSRFLLQLLGFWLLLSQPCRTRVSEEWMDGFIRMCGREYARELIKICGASVGRLALSQEEPALLARQATGERLLISPLLLMLPIG